MRHPGAQGRVGPAEEKDLVALTLAVVYAFDVGAYRVHVYLASAVGLLLLGGGLGSAMTRSLETLYDRLVRPGRVLVSSGTGLREAAVSVVVGAVVWWWHWGHRGRGDRGSTGWHVTLFLVGVLGGVAIAVTAASTLVFTGLAWPGGTGRRRGRRGLGGHPDRPSLGIRMRGESRPQGTRHRSAVGRRIAWTPAPAGAPPGRRA